MSNDERTAPAPASFIETLPSGAAGRDKQRFLDAKPEQPPVTANELRSVIRGLELEREDTHRSVINTLRLLLDWMERR